MRRRRLTALAVALLSVWLAAGQTAPSLAGRRASRTPLPAVQTKQASREVLETTPLHDPAPQDFAGPVPTRVPAVPRTAVIWNRQGTGTYLWDAPAGRIVGRLENGHVVFLLENWQAAGGVPFGEVLWAEAQVWADMRHVHRVVLPASGFRTVAGLGAGLYTAPGGARLSWLPPGTPFLPSAAAGPDGWLPVKLLVGGEAGWIPSAALQP